MTMVDGSSRTIASLMAGERMAPPDRMTVSDDTSQGRAWTAASNASTRGRAMASPTITRKETCSSATSCHTRAASRWRSGEMTTVPPPNSVQKATQWAVPCMNGQAGSMRPPPLRAASAMSSGFSMPGPPGFPPCSAPKKMSSWRHSTPLGMPVVPPV